MQVRMRPGLLRERQTWTQLGSCVHHVSIMCASCLDLFAHAHGPPGRFEALQATCRCMTSADHSFTECLLGVLKCCSSPLKTSIGAGSCNTETATVLRGQSMIAHTSSGIGSQLWGR